MGARRCVRVHETCKRAVSLRMCMCMCSVAAVCDSTLDAVERDVRFSLQVVLFLRLSLKVQGGGCGGLFFHDF